MSVTGASLSRKLDSEYKLDDKVLGSGGFSEVRKAERLSDGEEFAVKIIDKKNVGSDMELISKEIMIMRKLSHPSIIKLEDVFESKTHIYMVMELVGGGELFDRIVERGFFSEEDARTVVANMVSAIAYLHKNHIIHRDLKPENLLCASKEAVDVKLADFGLSTMYDESFLLRTTCGTPGYVAPEILTQRGYDQAVDLWSIGVIMYILLCGFPPFYHDNNQALFAAIIRGEYDFPPAYWSKISPEAVDLVKKLMTVDRKKRATVEQVLAHPWMAHEQSKDDLEGMVARLEEFNGKRKFRGAAITVEAVNRMLKIIDMMKEDVQASKAASTWKSKASTPSPKDEDDSGVPPVPRTPSDHAAAGEHQSSRSCCNVS